MLAGEGSCEGELGWRAEEEQVGVVSRLEVAIIFTINGDSFISQGGFFAGKITACVQ